MEKTVVLRQGEVASASGLEVRLKEIVIEEIAPSRDGAYPAGSGVTVKLSLKKDDDSAEILLSRLSEGYESKSLEEWKGFSIRLVDADEEKIKVKIWNSR